MLTEETRRIINELFKAEDKVERYFKYLEAYFEVYDEDIKAKSKRIEELKSENDLLKSKNQRARGRKTMLTEEIILSVLFAVWGVFAVKGIADWYLGE